MKITPNELYHIYNQGNNHEQLFFLAEDYIVFMRLFRKFVTGYCPPMAWCLMPNHFHFVIYTSDLSVEEKVIGNIFSNSLSNGFRLLQSAYAQYINARRNRSGSLFRQKTKAKCLSEGDEHYALTAFHYVHQNPLNAGLVLRLEDWHYSSYRDYVGLRKGSLCDKDLGAQLIGFSQERFIEESYEHIDQILIKKIFLC